MPSYNNPSQQQSSFPFKTMLFAGAAIIGLIVLMSVGGKILETNDAGHYKVMQAAITGKLTAIMKPGWFFQMWGDVFDYHQADTFRFIQEKGDNNELEDGTAIDVRFNDGAMAYVNGSVRFELPIGEKLIALHTKFRGYEVFVHDGVQQLINEAVILTSALMSAEESYTTKRSSFAEMASDQVSHGIYLTEQKSEDVSESNPAEGEKKAQRITTVIRRDDKGNPIRRRNTLDDYGVKLSQFVITAIDYEKTVDDRIRKKQEALMATVQARAEAERAMQQRITAEEEGKKNVAVAEYEALVTKKREVVEGEKKKEVAVLDAQQKLEVERLNAQAAAEYKKATLLRAEGESEAARKKFQADGALERKLAAWLDAQKAWAQVVATSQHPLVPGIVIGSNGHGGNAALDFMQMLGAKAASDLALTLRPGK